MDHVSARRRSEIMRRIRGADTEPELAVRRFLHANGLRYRVHRRDLPGCPDIVFPSKRLCVFVQGCFWHGCPHCRTGRRQVKSNESYWLPKIARTKERDRTNRECIESRGWRVFEIWECQIVDKFALVELADVIKESPLYKRATRTELN